MGLLLDATFITKPSHSRGGPELQVNGAGALAHEARHSLDFKRIGYPGSKAAEYRTELNAYRTEQGVYEGLGLTTSYYSPGASRAQNDAAVQAAAQRSTDAFCAAGGPC